MPTVRLIPSTYYQSNTQYTTVSGAANMYANTDSTSYATIQNTRNSTSNTYYVYVRGFNFSDVPDDAEVSSFTVKIKASEANLSTSSSYRMSLYNGTTSISNTTVTSSLSTTATVFTFPIPASLTWATLKGYGSNLGIRVPLRRANTNSSSYAYVYGAEIEVTYTVPVYHNVTVTNSTSATVTANPATVIEGSSSVVTSDTLSGITVTDNTVDVTSQFVEHSGTNGDYAIAKRGSYGFTLNTGTGYYTSDNKGVDKSCSVCRVSFSLPVSATVTFQYINYAEATYDFGVFGNVDVALTTNYYPASSSGATISETSYKKACNTSADNTSSVQTLTYSGISAGDHFIDVKFSKDDGTASNNDTLQFKVSITYSQTVTYYAYTISNIQTDHAIVVMASGGTPPIITVGTPSRTIISDESGYDQCTCTFRSDLALQAWEARATKDGTTPARGVGLLVESGTTLAANTNATVIVDNEELTNGDGEYTITVYGQSTGGVWSE